MRPSVLIIEPQLEARMLLEMLLTGEGVRVFSAPGIESALLQLRVRRPDLIVAGSGMPASEWEACAAQIRAACDVPLLLLESGAGHPGPAVDEAGRPPAVCVAGLCGRMAALLGGAGRSQAA